MKMLNIFRQLLCLKKPMIVERPPQGAGFSHKWGFEKGLFFICVLFSVCAHAERVYLIPCESLSMESILSSPGRDLTSMPFIRLKQALEFAGYDVCFSSDGKNIDDPLAIISFGRTDPSLLEQLNRFPKEKCLLFSFEPPVVCPYVYNRACTYAFGKVFVLWQDGVDNVHYFKFHYPQPHLSMIENSIPFDQKRFSAVIAGNKYSGHPNSLYSARLDVVSFFENMHPEELDLYGSGWEGYFCSRGGVPSKWETLKQYKFNFCYENMSRQNGYITEKIFDAMIAGCVPVYLGADDITDYVPSACFIDRRNFLSNKELYEFLHTIDAREHAEYVEAMREFFDSSQSQVFSIDYFIQTIINEINAIKLLY